MADSILRIIFNLLKQGSGDTEAVRGLQGVVGMYTELNSALSLGRQALAGVQQAFDATVGATIRYGVQVEDLSRLIGATPEDASKLIQAADDMRVSYEGLTRSLQFAMRQGIDPTIEGVGRLADQYVAIQDPIARSRFLLETFGRTGTEMGLLMEQGSAGIRAMGDEAERFGLVLSQQTLADIEATRVALDGLNDAWAGLKIVLTTEVLPLVTPLLTFFKNLILTIRDSSQESTHWAQLLAGPVGYAIGMVARAIGLTTAETEASTGALDAHTNALNRASTAYGTLRQRASGSYGMIVAGQHIPFVAPGGQAGGRFSVPTGYSGDRYPVLVSSGETLDVTPAGHTPPGGALTVVVQYMPALSLASRREAEEVISPFVAGAVRRELERRAA